MKNYQEYDKKPRNYNYLTFKIISTLSNEGKIELLKYLEKALLKSIYYKPPREEAGCMKHIKTYSGKVSSRITSIWYSEMFKQQKIAKFLMKVNRIKFN